MAFWKNITFLKTIDSGIFPCELSKHYLLFLTLSYTFQIYCCSKSPVRSGRTNSSPSKSSLSSSSMRRPSPAPMGPFGTPVSPTHGSAGRPASLMDQNQGQAHVVRVVVNRDERGYGMKVSGDNPVYVQSVKEGTKM